MIHSGNVSHYQSLLLSVDVLYRPVIDRVEVVLVTLGSSLFFPCGCNVLAFRQLTRALYFPGCIGAVPILYLSGLEVSFPILF